MSPLGVILGDTGGLGNAILEEGSGYSGGSQSGVPGAQGQRHVRTCWKSLFSGPQRSYGMRSCGAGPRSLANKPSRAQLWETPGDSAQAEATGPSLLKLKSPRHKPQPWSLITVHNMTQHRLTGDALR